MIRNSGFWGKPRNPQNSLPLYLAEIFPPEIEHNDKIVFLTVYFQASTIADLHLFL